MLTMFVFMHTKSVTIKVEQLDYVAGSHSYHLRFQEWQLDQFKYIL